MEKKLEALCAKHQLQCISVSFYPDFVQKVSVFAHLTYGVCAEGKASTFSEAFKIALFEVEKYRG